MATIRDLLTNRTIHYIEPHQTVLEAAKYMVECNVGAAPVLEGSKLAGVFSERDIMSKVVIRGLDPRTTRISEVMSVTLHTVAPEAHCGEAMLMMQTHGIRHLPVCEGPAAYSRREVRRGGDDARLHPDVGELIPRSHGAPLHNRTASFQSGVRHGANYAPVLNSWRLCRLLQYLRNSVKSWG